MTTIEIVIKAVLAISVGTFALSLAGFLTWVERKQSAVIQDRIGANRATIFGFRILGLFHPIADVLKLIMKEDFTPRHAHKFLFQLAPILSVFFAIIAFAAIPVGDTITIGSKIFNLQVVNLNIGILYVFAFMSMGIYGVVLAGFASNNNYSFLGGLRAISQMLSYEIAMGVSIIGLCMIYETVGLQEMVRAQGQYCFFGIIPKWGIVVQPLGFLLFLTAAMAETKRTPFDLPEGESEIIGYNLEYSGMKFAMFMMTDFLETVLISALLTTLFLGGWQVPYLSPEGFQFPGGWHIPLGHLSVVVLGILSFIAKVIFFCWFLMMVRWTLPRFRYDQLMRLGWKMMLPLALANIVITGLLILLGVI
ncbi:MAG: NADH-quinone oxidoreductase subunit H [Chlamydiota bacterium]|nr:NADH-quinone oxidoreductase subunit H [Chlamydiota bacterium]